MDKHLIRQAILGNNLLWRCAFTDELVILPEYDLTYTFGVDQHFMSSCQRINVPAENVSQVITQVESFYRQRRKPVSFYLDPSTQPADFVQTLVQYGYQEYQAEEEIWWSFDLKNSIPNFPAVSGLKIVECRQRQQFEDHLHAAMAGYQDFKFWASLLSKSFRKSLDGVDVIHYVAYKDNLPVSCSTLGIYLDIAFLINTAVVPAYRRQGIHTQMMLRRLQDAQSLGAKIAFYQTDFDNDASIATGRKVGFSEAFRRRLFTKD